MYHYIVEYWDKEGQRNVRESGLIGADTYSTAAEKLTNFYGDELYSMELAAWEDILTESEVLDGFVHEVEED